MFMEALGAAGLGMSLYNSFAGQGAMQQGMKESLALTKQGLALSEEQLRLSNYKYQRWNEIFGPIQQHLADYYGSLDPKDFQARMGTDLETAYAESSKRLSQNLAQRGIQGSGIEAAALTQLETQRAETAATLPYAAESEVARQQSQFLAGGMAERQLLEQGQASAYGTAINAAFTGAGTMNQLYSQQMQYYQQQAQGYGQFAGYMFGRAMTPGQASSAGTPSSADMMAWTYGG